MTDDRDRKLKITETVLRDAQQSLIATRMTTEDMEPILEKLDGVGYHSIECWGGATFDACLRFLRSVAETAHTAKKAPKQQTANASERPEPSRIQELRRRYGGVLREKIHIRGHRYNTCIRRPQ